MMNVTISTMGELSSCLCLITLHVTVQFLQASDLQQLQQLVQTSSSSINATDAAAAYAAVTRLLSGNQPATAAAATPVLQLLAPAWQAALPAATIQDVGNVLLCWSKLRYTNAQLWGSSLAAVPGLCSAADGQDLANVALALATAAEAGGGAVPGVTREEAEELLRWVGKLSYSAVCDVCAERGFSSCSSRGGRGCGARHQAGVTREEAEELLRWVGKFCHLEVQRVLRESSAAAAAAEAARSDYSGGGRSAEVGQAGPHANMQCRCTEHRHAVAAAAAHACGFGSAGS
jgi:hypothetical protein